MWNPFADNTAKVLRVFTKAVTRMEAIVAKQEAAVIQMNKRIEESKAEIQTASKAVANFKKLVGMENNE